MYNADETGTSLGEYSRKKIECDSTTKRPVRCSSSTKTSITSLHCICADGTIMPPAVLFAGKIFPSTVAAKFPLSYYVGVTENVWMEKAQFYAWVANSFVPNLRPQRPVLLLVDGHASHIDLNTLEICKKMTLSSISYTSTHRI